MHCLDYFTLKLVWKMKSDCKRMMKNNVKKWKQ